MGSYFIALMQLENEITDLMGWFSHGDIEKS